MLASLWKLIYFVTKIESFIFINFFTLSLRRWWSVFVFCIESCNFNYCYLALFIAIWIISLIMIRFITFKTTIILFILHFRMRAFVLRWYFEITFWLILLFRITEITKFIRLLISIELMLEKFVALWLKIIIIVIITRAIKYCFLHNNFEQYNLSDIKHIFHNKKLFFQHWSKLN